MSEPHAPAPVRRGDHVRLEVETMAMGPDALARIGSYVVMLAGALPGEHVRATITSGARKYGRARLLHIDQPSPHRREPRCRHFLQCGGCHWQHADYLTQLQWKQQRLQQELAHTLGADAPPVRPTLPAPEPYGQRHKVALHLLPRGRSGLQMALHRLRDPELVALQECPAVAAPALALARAAIDVLADLGLPAWDPVTGNGLLRSVLVRRAQATGQSHVVIVATDHLPELEDRCTDLLAKGATTISVNHNRDEEARLLGPETRVLAGPPRIEERIGDTTYCISPDAFFQTSPAGAADLVRTVLQFLAPEPRDHVADLYCGGGLFALPLAERSASVVGIEESPVAIGDGAASARRNRRRNVQFVRGPTEQIVKQLGNGQLPRPDLAVLDPPRAGALPAVLQRLAALRPRRIAYVACDPVALARDLAVLRPLGYAAREVVPIDMFPQTWHVEAVALLLPTDAPAPSQPQ